MLIIQIDYPHNYFFLSRTRSAYKEVEDNDLRNHNGRYRTRWRTLPVAYYSNEFEIARVKIPFANKSKLFPTFFSLCFVSKWQNIIVYKYFHDTFYKHTHLHMHNISFRSYMFYDAMLKKKTTEKVEKLEKTNTQYWLMSFSISYLWIY